MDPARRKQLIERYRAAISAVLVAVDHVPENALDDRPTPKSFSAREVIHHLADSEMREGIRMRRMLAENKPVLPHWDPAHYLERLHYDRPIHLSLDAFRATGLSNIELLECLTEDQWRREGNVQKPWNLTVEGWLEENLAHVHDCLLQIMNAHTGGRVIPDPT
jgi:hypothetical protein